jgi:hypothetical protein
MPEPIDVQSERIQSEQAVMKFDHCAGLGVHQWRQVRVTGRIVVIVSGPITAKLQR